MRSSAILPMILVTGMLAVSTLTANAQAPATLLIKGATIIDGLSDAPLRERSLLIEANAIRDLLPADAAEIRTKSGKDLMTSVSYLSRRMCGRRRLHADKQHLGLSFEGREPAARWVLATVLEHRKPIRPPPLRDVSPMGECHNAAACRSNHARVPAAPPPIFHTVRG